jgi:hypothetical protein
MSETGAVGFVRRRRSRAEAAELVREFEASGLRRHAFCAGRGLSVAALDKYRRHVAAATQGTAGSEGRLVTVEVMPGNSTNKVDTALCVELASGRRIGVGSGFDAATLERLLAVLEQA